MSVVNLLQRLFYYCVSGHTRPFRLFFLELTCNIIIYFKHNVNVLNNPTQFCTLPVISSHNIRIWPEPQARLIYPATHPTISHKKRPRTEAFFISLIFY